jgi:hypothetical protein
VRVPGYGSVSNDAGGALCWGFRNPNDLLANVQRVDALNAAEDARRISEASLTNSRKRRGRPPDPAVQERRNRLLELARALRPATIRQLYYQAEIREWVTKTEKGYDAVQRDLVLLRKAGRRISDSSRWMRKPTTFNNIQQALEDWAAQYRKALWQNAETHIEFWIEKDALSGTLYPLTSKYDVPLFVAKGYSSLTCMRQQNTFQRSESRHTFIISVILTHQGRTLRGRSSILREMTPDAEIHFERLAVNLRQIEQWKLPTRETKKEDPRAAAFGSEISCELDAISPDRLRSLVQNAIDLHLPQRELDILMVAEQSERETLHDIVGDLLRGDAS